MEKRLMLVTLVIMEKMYHNHKAIISISLLCSHTHTHIQRKGNKVNLVSIYVDG